MKYTARLEIINSKTDRNGNRYWAFTFTDFQTGKTVSGLGDGESNLSGMIRYWNVQNDYDRSVIVDRAELPIRQYNRQTKGWKYAGCLPEDVAKFVRAGLGPTPAEWDATCKKAREGFAAARSGYDCFGKKID